MQMNKIIDFSNITIIFYQDIKNNIRTMYSAHNSGSWYNEVT